MKYLRKSIEIDTSGHMNEYWECDFTTVDLSQLGAGLISVVMKGTKSLESKNSGKRVSDMRLVTVSAVDLGLNGSIGYSDVPKLYQILTTKTIKQQVFNLAEEVDVPAYPEFFGGTIEEVL